MVQSYPAQVTNVVLCPPWHSYYLVIFCVSICYGDIYLNHYPMWLPFSLTIIPMRPGIDPMALLIVSSGIECSVSLKHFEYSSKFSLVMILFKACNSMQHFFCYVEYISKRIHVETARWNRKYLCSNAVNCNLVLLPVLSWVSIL